MSAVSVIVPVRNGIDHLDRAIAALARLRGCGVEIILFDDGSTDGSAEILRRAAAEQGWVFRGGDGRGGVAEARRRAMELARSEWLWFVDIDDVWDEGILEVLLEAATRHDADVVCCRARRREADGRTWVMEGGEHERVLHKDDITRAVLDGDIRGYLWNKLFRRRVLEGPARRQLSSQDDFLTVLDALTRCERVVLIPDLLYEYIEQDGSISTQNTAQIANTAACTEEVLGRWLPSRGYGAAAAEREYFRLWFHIVPCVTTPVHRGWPKDIARRTRRALGPQIRISGIVEALRRGRPALAAHAIAIRVGGPAFPALYASARWALTISTRLRGAQKKTEDPCSTPSPTCSTTTPIKSPGVPR